MWEIPKRGGPSVHVDIVEVAHTGRSGEEAPCSPARHGWSDTRDDSTSCYALAET